MYMTVSKLSRKDASECSSVDIETIVPAIATWDAYWDYIVAKQGEGKIIYRAASINANAQIETVTLYSDKTVYDEFKADPVWAAFESHLSAIYKPATVTEEVI